ncbi:DMT family transporter [Actinoallomurus iriomotensis]|uniref:DMT family transporter n=1 Tax=Actinoallomurus iriomotensis TaxID=478107 RepID=UPI0032DB4C35
MAGYVYLGVVGTAIGYWLWFRGVSRLPATSVAFLTLLSPLSAAVIGWAALGQALTPLQVLGMTIAFGGTLLGQTRRTRPHPTPEPTPAPAPARAC